MKKAVIIPTGDEVRAGLVLDTDSPALMELILEKYPLATVVRAEPVSDTMDEVRRSILSYAGSDLIIVVGGSGGGKTEDPSLAPDVTHTALENILEVRHTKEIYGGNGHLWSRLLIGRVGETIVANVPGPMVEAVAAARAVIEGLAARDDLETVARRTAEAVVRQYPRQGGV